jgi:hypothetical protein
MTVIGWKPCLLWTAHTPCGVNSLRKSNQIKSNQIKRERRAALASRYVRSSFLATSCSRSFSSFRPCGLQWSFSLTDRQFDKAKREVCDIQLTNHRPETPTGLPRCRHRVQKLSPPVSYIRSSLAALSSTLLYTPVGLGDPSCPSTGQPCS